LKFQANQVRMAIHRLPAQPESRHASRARDGPGEHSKGTRR
jgi:hypothetical protein